MQIHPVGHAAVLFRFEEPADAGQFVGGHGLRKGTVRLLPVDMPLGLPPVLPLEGSAGGAVDDMDILPVFADPVRHGDMPGHDHEGQQVAPLQAVGDAALGLDQVLLGGESVILRGLGDQAGIVGPPAGNVEPGVLDAQVLRQDVLPGEAEPLENMAEAEDGAAAFFQRFNRLFGPVDDAVPPAVLLAVNNVGPLLPRGCPGDGDGDAGGLFVLLPVDHRRGQGIFPFGAGTEGRGIVGCSVFFPAYGLLPEGEGVAHSLSPFPARCDGHVHIIADGRVRRGKGDPCLRGSGSAEQEHRQQRQREKDADSLSHSLTSGQKSSYYIREKERKQGLC